MQEDAKIEQKRVKNMFEKQMRGQHRFCCVFCSKICPKLVNFGVRIMKKVTLDVNLEAKKHRVGA